MNNLKSIFYNKFCFHSPTIQWILALTDLLKCIVNILGLLYIRDFFVCISVGMSVGMSLRLYIWQKVNIHYFIYVLQQDWGTHLYSHAFMGTMVSSRCRFLNITFMYLASDLINNSHVEYKCNWLKIKSLHFPQFSIGTRYLDSHL